MYRLCIGNSYNNNNKLYLVTRIESKALLRSVDSVYKKYNKSTSKPYEYVYLNHCCTELNYRTKLNQRWHCCNIKLCINVVKK